MSIPVKISTDSDRSLAFQGKRQRCRASWLLVAFLWFGVLVPNLHHGMGTVGTVGTVSAAGSAHIVPSPFADFGSGVHFSPRAAASDDCPLCDWLVSAVYTTGSRPQTSGCRVLDTESALSDFPLLALCDRSLPYRIPRAPPALFA